MPTQSKRPKATAPHRDISPLGASKFERPYSPPSRAHGRASTNTSPSLDAPVHSSEPRTSTTTSHTSPSLTDPAAIEFSKPSLASTLPTSHGASSPSSSVDRFEQALDAISNSSCPRAEDRDEWFLRQTEEGDLDIPTIEGDLCPDGATLAAVREIPIYDAEGNARPFASLYDPNRKPPNHRQLIIFIRHFYCGACQAFVKAITEGITMEDYFSIPVPTSIILIGCGAPDLIPQYKKFTHGCHFPIFAEPTRKLFKMLGMRWSASLGSRPEYMREISVLDVVKGNVRDIGAGLKDPEGLRKRDVLRGGNLFQIGGEFLFEEGEVVWCHRMRHMRGHAEVAVLRKLLELDVEGT